MARMDDADIKIGLDLERSTLVIAFKMGLAIGLGAALPVALAVLAATMLVQ